MFLFSTTHKSAEAAFKEYDTDGNGQLSVDEICNAAVLAREKEKAVHKPVKARIAALCPKFAKSDTGKLGINEFKQLCSYLERGHAVQDELLEAWLAVEEAQAEVKRLRAKMGQCKIDAIAEAMALYCKASFKTSMPSADPRGEITKPLDAVMLKQRMTPTAGLAPRPN